MTEVICSEDIVVAEKSTIKSSGSLDSGVAVNGDKILNGECNPVSSGNSSQASNGGESEKGSSRGSNNSICDKSSKTDIDDLLPADSYISCIKNRPVKLHLSESGPLGEKPITVMTALRKTAEKFAEHPALAAKIDNEWKIYSYKEYYRLVCQTARGFIQLGLMPHYSVGILGFNAPEWFLSDLGAIFAGGFASGIYTTNNAEACHYVAENSRCNIIVVENDTQLQKILKVWDRLPDLKAVVQYSGKLKELYPNVYTWEQLMELGDKCSEETLLARMSEQAPNKCCSLIYTSGTTGNPKGVMLSHDNLTWTASMAGNQAQVKYMGEMIVSYLPLSHIAAQILDIFVPICYAGTVYFAQPDALKGSLADTLRDVRPTSFLGVPRVWEKMQEKMTSVGKSQGYLKRSVARWAKGVGLQGNESRMNGSGMPFGWTLASMLVFKKVRKALGLDRCRLCMTAAAPIMKDTLDFFASLDIPLFEIYGLSETSGPHTMSVPWQYRHTSIGSNILGCSTKVDNPDQDGNGELMLNGRNIFMGYLDMEDKTREVLDEEGWLRSGDVGKIDEQNFIYVTGRIKELLITAGGENVAPVLIEDSVKEHLPCVSNCMLVGDRKKYLSILLTLKTELNPDTSEPTDKLSSMAVEWCRNVGCKASSVSELLTSKDEKVMKGIQEGIDRVNGKAISRAQTIQKWTILPVDFSIGGGELGPTLKLKRPIVNKKYSAVIDSLYVDATAQ